MMLHLAVPALAVLLVLIASLLPSSSRAGEEPEHRHLIFALALGAGFSPEDARTISDASYSQDENASVIAFDDSDFRPQGARARIATMSVTEFRQMLNNDDALDAELYGDNGTLRRIGSSALIHTLTGDPRQAPGTEIRATLDASFHRYMREQDEVMQTNGESRANRHATNLILAGQYLHSFIDAFSHPDDAVAGHLLFGHIPDQAVHRPEHYKEAAFWTLKELKLLREKLETIDTRGALFALNDDDDQRRFANRMVDAIVEGYRGEILGEKITDFTVIGLAQAKFALRALASIRFPYDEAQFAQRIEDALNADPQRLHSTYTVRFPPHTKVDFDLLPDGSMHIYYPRVGETGLSITVDDLLAWFSDHPEYADLKAAIRENVRDYIRDYPERLSRMREALQSMISDLRDKAAAIRRAVALQDRLKEARAQLQAKADLLPPWNNIDPVFVVQERQRQREADQQRREAREAEEAAERRRQREAERQWREENRPPRDDGHRINVPTLEDILRKL